MDLELAKSQTQQFYMDPNMALAPYPTSYNGFGPSRELNLTSKGFLHGPILRVR
jgi:hypothetical protein